MAVESQRPVNPTRPLDFRWAVSCPTACTLWSCVLRLCHVDGTLDTFSGQPTGGGARASTCDSIAHVLARARTHQARWRRCPTASGGVRVWLFNGTPQNTFELHVLNQHARPSSSSTSRRRQAPHSAASAHTWSARCWRAAPRRRCACVSGSKDNTACIVETQREEAPAQREARARSARLQEEAWRRRTTCSRRRPRGGGEGGRGGGGQAAATELAASRRSSSYRSRRRAGRDGDRDVPGADALDAAEGAPAQEARRLLVGRGDVEVTCQSTARSTTRSTRDGRRLPVAHDARLNAPEARPGGASLALCRSTQRARCGVEERARVAASKLRRLVGARTPAPTMLRPKSTWSSRRARCSSRKRSATGVTGGGRGSAGGTGGRAGGRRGAADVLISKRTIGLPTPYKHFCSP